MGHWGFRSWENDAAADWLGSFAEQTEIEKHIRDGLSLPADCFDEIRAAANLLLAMSKLQCVSGESRRKLARIAIERLSNNLESGGRQHLPHTALCHQTSCCDHRSVPNCSHSAANLVERGGLTVPLPDR